MELTNEQLQCIIDENPVGNTFPYNTKDEREIERYIENFFYSLNRSQLMKCFGEFNHYGSGYASFVDVFCCKKDGSSVIQNESNKRSSKELKIEGLTIYISRLAPVAVIAEDMRYLSDPQKETDEYFSAFGFLQAKDVLAVPPHSLSEIYNEIILKLQEAGYIILEKEYLSQQIPFKTRIPTILTSQEKDYTIFDAIFYWMD